ncbi:hypothetical protein [Roseisolibacter agri]|uniref:Uncharacterized protein n=1 Tax=Roseisolibacter agri TaxID=2014610 RepID=A0AA37V4R3_9BACT|nr:hypothetical protein [Roseisolibacter agri]GLC28272.1 hypothetical protein rosag_47850 [Roseisolibacter agri]
MQPDVPDGLRLLSLQADAEPPAVNVTLDRGALADPACLGAALALCFAPLELASVYRTAARHVARALRERTTELAGAPAAVSSRPHVSTSSLSGALPGDDGADRAVLTAAPDEGPTGRSLPGVAPSSSCPKGDTQRGSASRVIKGPQAERTTREERM